MLMSQSLTDCTLNNYNLGMLLGLMDHLLHLVERGGVVMLPIMMLSLVSLTLILERFWFWCFGGGHCTARTIATFNELLRIGDRDSIEKSVKRKHTIFASLIRAMLSNGTSDAVAIAAIEHERPRFERYMVALSTIITAAPLLGILGTVIGIIDSFQLLGDQTMLTDPADVAGGIASALLTTAAGLTVALFTLFPYMFFKSWASQSISHLETLVASAQQCEENNND